MAGIAQQAGSTWLSHAFGENNLEAPFSLLTERNNYYGTPAVGFDAVNVRAGGAFSREVWDVNERAGRVIKYPPRP
jgi:hypothetical protein